jgi:hypothetical protein
MNPSPDTQAFMAQPSEIHAAVLKDWVRCLNNGWMRGTGLTTHWLYLDMIAQEHDITILDVCAHEPRAELI